MDPEVEQPLVETCLELGEVAFDQFLNCDVAKDIPIVGIAIRVCTTFDNIRNRAYAAKLAAFIKELDRVSPKDREEFRQKILASKKEMNRLGEHLILVLERISDTERPAILATFFVAYLDELIDAATLRRFSECIADAFLDDIKTLLGFPTSVRNNMHLVYLHKTGLTEIQAGQTIDTSGELSFKVSGLGSLFIETYHSVRRKHQMS